MIRIKLLLIAVILSGTAFGIPVDSLFLKAPATVLPTLSKKQRYELAEYFKAGKSDSVPNLFGRNTLLLKYDTANCHIVIKTSATGTTEIKRFKFPDGNLILGVINTVNKPLKYSVLNFYNEEWLPVTVQIDFPDYRQWVNEKQLAESTTEAGWVLNLLQKKYFSMHFSETNELEFENNVLSTLNVEDLKLAEPFFLNKTISVKFIK